jgi:hypothetical protein
VKWNSNPSIIVDRCLSPQGGVAASWRKPKKFCVSRGRLRQAKRLSSLGKDRGTENLKMKVGRCVSPRKQKPHRPGIAPALGLRAGSDVSVLYPRPSEEANNESRKQGIGLFWTLAQKNPDFVNPFGA